MWPFARSYLSTFLSVCWGIELEEGINWDSLNINFEFLGNVKEWLCFYQHIKTYVWWTTKYRFPEARENPGFDIEEVHVRQGEKYKEGLTFQFETEYTEEPELAVMAFG